MNYNQGIVGFNLPQSKQGGHLNQTAF